MNERIVELAKQAGMKKQHGSDQEYIGDFDWREFSRLIVEECVDQFCRQGAVSADGGIVIAVKKHFGVEE